MKTLSVIIVSALLAVAADPTPAQQPASPGNSADAPGQVRLGTGTPGNSNGAVGEKQAQGQAKAKDKGPKVGNVKRGYRGEPQDPTDALAAQARHGEAMLTIPGVIGHGVSWNKNGSAVVKLFTKEKAGNGELPASLDGIEVVEHFVGNIYSLNVPCEERVGKSRCRNGDTTDASPDANPRSRQQRPVPIGVSVGSDAMAGTLACRVSRGCHDYALTNAHVASDPGTETLVQPATHDGGINPDDALGNWYEAVPIVLGTDADSANRVDAAIFVLEDAAVGTATPADGYGEPKMETTAASLSMQVQKYGRSSSKTEGYIDTINATVIVTYPTGEARFVEQIIVSAYERGGDFSLPGDSGALLVGNGGEDDRKPVGLLFASGYGISVANPIDEVLYQLDVNVDGAF